MRLWTDSPFVGGVSGALLACQRDDVLGVQHLHISFIAVPGLPVPMRGPGGIMRMLDGTPTCCNRDGAEGDFNECSSWCGSDPRFEEFFAPPRAGIEKEPFEPFRRPHDECDFFQDWQREDAALAARPPRTWPRRAAWRGLDML
uniref:Uncharacterized protein n=1 Tax=Noctiluca scintillans TaxID=2966 RepID=A0A7S1FC14_NOCSC|mmetsp:Transcript_48887/g.129549  ORF Transcript_48887/g.129549 Transcript_48887/m.129549 type:complete len:144 (+) Transcript_48887:43-474(+)